MGLRAIAPMFVVALAACSGDDSRLALDVPPASGLDERPQNTACVAPERDIDGARLAAPLAFPLLSFEEPVALLQAPADASRWFVVERAGRIRTFANDESTAGSRDFLDLRERISGTGALLGLAFHPGFAGNGRAFVHYVTASGGGLRAVAAEYTSPDGGLTLDPATERVLLSVAVQSADRNAGPMAFGRDGYLYLGLADGGRPGLAQDSSRLAGKLLRLDVDRRAAGADYAIPRDNPFAGQVPCQGNDTGAGPCPEIYASGFRSPRNLSVDRRTGQLWVADGSEVNLVRRGGNYGWPLRAGSRCLDPQADCTSAGLADPVAVVERHSGTSIMGGIVYRGREAPALAGRYVFAETPAGRISMIAPGGGVAPSIEPLSNDSIAVSALGEAADGTLYAIGGARGEIRRLELDVADDNVPDLLSETGCLNTAGAGAPPLLSLIPYGLNAAFWSDGAHKERWLGLPDGARITVPDDGDWDLPAGTVIVKHFRLGERLAETRLFMRHPDGGWAGYTYQWNEAQTEATRVRGGLIAPIDGQDWVFPSEGDCLFCHNTAAGDTLGLETVQLNSNHFYPQTGRTRNQLVTLNSLDVLSPPAMLDTPPLANPGDESQTLEARARSYLHVNCSFCHRPGGPTPALMDLRLGTPLAATEACDAVPTLGDLGIPDARIIAPGDPDRSELLSRMSRRDAFGMPPLASLQPDTAGVALMRAWIESLTPDNCL